MLTDDLSLRTFEDVARDYQKRWANSAKAERNVFGNSRQTLKGAIVRACRSLIPKKHGIGTRRHPHQPAYAIPDEALSRAEHELLAITERIAAAADFSHLHDCVEAVLRPVPHIGELAIYDFAQRIGAFRGIHPTEIYLHAGTREGARALGLDCRRKTLSQSDLPRGLQALTAEDTEDLLCIYRRTLARIYLGSIDKPRHRSCGGETTGSA